MPNDLQPLLAMFVLPRTRVGLRQLCQKKKKKPESAAAVVRDGVWRNLIDALYSPAAPAGDAVNEPRANLAVRLALVSLLSAIAASRGLKGSAGWAGCRVAGRPASRACASRAFRGAARTARAFAVSVSYRA